MGQNQRSKQFEKLTLITAVRLQLRIGYEDHNQNISTNNRINQNIKKFLGFTNLPLLSKDIDEAKTQAL